MTEEKLNQCQFILLRILSNGQHTKSRTIQDLLYDIQTQLRSNRDKVFIDNALNVAVVGAFSCGKSSFINSIIDEDIEPVDITPVNHANTIFTYGEKKNIKSGNRLFFQVEYENEVKKLDSEYKEFLIEYPCEALRNIKLYDTPGFGSVNAGESDIANSDIELSKRAANIADTIFYLVDITNGTIDNTSLKYLKEIKNNKNVYVILTHSDKKSPKARETIKETISNQIQDIGLNKDKVITYSSLNNEELAKISQGALFNIYKEEVRKELISLNKNLHNENTASNNIENICKQVIEIANKYRKKEQVETNDYCSSGIDRDFQLKKDEGLKIIKNFFDEKQEMYFDNTLTKLFELKENKNYFEQLEQLYGNSSGVTSESEVTKNNGGNFITKIFRETWKDCVNIYNIQNTDIETKICEVDNLIKEVKRNLELKHKKITDKNIQIELESMILNQVFRNLIEKLYPLINKDKTNLNELNEKKNIEIYTNGYVSWYTNVLCVGGIILSSLNLWFFAPAVLGIQFFRRYRKRINRENSLKQAHEEIKNKIIKSRSKIEEKWIQDVNEAKDLKIKEIQEAFNKRWNEIDEEIIKIM